MEKEVVKLLLLTDDMILYVGNTKEYTKKPLKANKITHKIYFYPRKWLPWYIPFCLCSLHPSFGNKTFNFLSNHFPTCTPSCLTVKRVKEAYPLVYSSHLVRVGPRQKGLPFKVGKVYIWAPLS